MLVGLNKAPIRVQAMLVVVLAVAELPIPPHNQDCQKEEQLLLLAQQFLQYQGLMTLPDKFLGLVLFFQALRMPLVILRGALILVATMLLVVVFLFSLASMTLLELLLALVALRILSVV